MIDWFRSWSKGIVIAIIISTIIEMILPENTSKKYIKIIIGIFIVYTIISPVIEQFSGQSIDKYIELEDFELVNANVVESNNISETTNNSIIKIYSQNLENDMKTKLKNKGYIAEEIKITISDDDSYKIENLNIKISQKIKANPNSKETKTIVHTIKKVKVSLEKNSNQQNDGIVDENDKNEIKEFLKSTYDIDVNKINVS